VSVLNVAFYRFTRLEGAFAPEGLRAELESEARGFGLKGTILLATEGLNGFLAGEAGAVRAFLEGLRVRAPFRGLEAKESFSETVPFGRLRVRVRPQIIPLRGVDIDPVGATGERLAPAELKRWLDEGRDFVLLDTRNDFEVHAGTFERAEDFGLAKFQDFAAALERSSERYRDRPVVMFCTGGIRCEKATALAKKVGIPNVFQLEGGILKYFEEIGAAHYRGNCVVFDERGAVDANLKPVARAEYPAVPGSDRPWVE
jgi:UPF0176 protein